MTVHEYLTYMTPGNSSYLMKCMVMTSITLFAWIILEVPPLPSVTSPSSPLFIFDGSVALTSFSANGFLPPLFCFLSTCLPVTLLIVVKPFVEMVDVVCCVEGSDLFQTFFHQLRIYNSFSFLPNPAIVVSLSSSLLLYMIDIFVPPFVALST